jgi:hypothetical protein
MTQRKVVHVSHPPIATLPSCPPHQGARASRVLAAACLLLALILPIATIYGLSLSWPQALTATLSPAHAAAPPMPRLAAATVLALLPAALMAYALVIASKMFVSFSRGEYFTLNSVQRLRGFARAMCVAALAGIVVPLVIGWVLTAGTPAATALSVALSSHQAILLMFACVVWQMASVLAKAVALADENAAFV